MHTMKFHVCATAQLSISVVQTGSLALFCPPNRTSGPNICLRLSSCSWCHEASPCLPMVLMQAPTGQPQGLLLASRQLQDQPAEVGPWLQGQALGILPTMTILTPCSKGARSVWPRLCPYQADLFWGTPLCLPRLQPPDQSQNCQFVLTQWRQLRATVGIEPSCKPRGLRPASTLMPVPQPRCFAVYQLGLGKAAGCSLWC